VTLMIFFGSPRLQVWLSCSLQCHGDAAATRGPGEERSTILYGRMHDAQGGRGERTNND